MSQRPSPAAPPPPASARSLEREGAPTLPDLAAAPPAPARLEVGLAPLSDHNLYKSWGPIEGVFVATYEDLPVGRDVVMTLELPGELTVRARGQVEFVRPQTGNVPPGVGVRFSRLDRAGRDLLMRFAAKRAPLFYPVPPSD